MIQTTGRGKNSGREGASFRDPSGVVFWKGGSLYRQVNKSFSDNYDLLMRSGLYKELTDKGLLIPHKETKSAGLPAEAYKVLKPEFVEFISYPYEWCFSELRDAALTTLKIQKLALRFGMCLKDASAYNIQFQNGRPVLIDTLSFEKYREGAPWVAYRQFCRHFLAPLALMSFTDARLGQLLRVYIDGIPLDLASGLLPRKSWVRSAIFFHIHMHARSERRFSGSKVDLAGKPFSRAALEGLLDSLFSGVSALRVNPKGAEGADRGGPADFSPTEGEARAIERFIEAARPKLVWDFSAKEGLYGRLASRRGIHTIAFDADPAAVEKNYLAAREKKESRLLPLVLDLMNPSPALGWANEERESLVSRGPAELVLALGLIPRLAISNNVPFPRLAEFFASVCGSLVVEFIPKNDPQVQRLLQNRRDIFDFYTREGFEKAFRSGFRIVETYNSPESARVVYLMKKI